jgi:hypothetical protein
VERAGIAEHEVESREQTESREQQTESSEQVAWSKTTSNIITDIREQQTGRLEGEFQWGQIFLLRPEAAGEKRREQRAESRKQKAEKAENREQRAGAQQTAHLEGMFQHEGLLLFSAEVALLFEESSQTLLLMSNGYDIRQ